jgi:hypothetical protein
MTGEKFSLIGPEETPTSYELAATRISRRTSRPALAAAAAIVGVLVIAAAIGLMDRGGVAPDSRALGEPRSSARSVTVRCHELAAAACDRIVAAALDLIGPDATVESIDAWESLLCGDDLDCPPGRLAELRPLGSAVVEFGDEEPAGLVNVGERLAARGSAAGTGGAAGAAGGAREPALVAWLLR